MDIKILVATVKEYWMPEDDIYIPIQAGAAGKKELGYLSDATGDNISTKNPYYSEITALYWAWKNLDADYMGLCHYRRYFGKNQIIKNLERNKRAIFHRKDYEELFNKCDIIIPRKFNCGGARCVNNMNKIIIGLIWRKPGKLFMNFFQNTQEIS